MRSVSMARGLTPAGLLARLLLSAVLAFSGWLKLIDPDASVRAVRAYRILPEWLARPVGFGLPVLELALALLLLVGLGVRVAAVVSAVLMVIFIAGVASVWARGLSIDCGCFGGGGEVDQGQTRYLQEILRDLGLLGAACLLVVQPRTPFSLDAVLHPAAPTPAPSPAPDTAVTISTPATTSRQRWDSR